MTILKTNVDKPHAHTKDETPVDPAKLEQLAMARYLARKKWDWFGELLISLIPVECPGLGTVGVTKGMVLLWDPAILDQWSVIELAGALLHECLHVYNRHFDRAPGIPRMIANLGQDLAINSILQGSNVTLPKTVAYPKQFGFPDGLTSEEYIKLLLEKMEKEGQIVFQPKKGKGKSKGQCAGDPDNEPGFGRGQCGTCAGGNQEGNESEGTDAQNNGRSEAEIERIRRRVAEDIKNEASRSRGTVPEGLLRIADEILRPPTIRWQDKLARATRGFLDYVRGMDDYTYKVPSRRQSAVGFGDGCPIIPGMYSPKPRIAVGIDTSGSMGAEEMLMALSECRGILEVVDTEVDFLSCDAEVHAIGRVETVKEMRDLLHGGGGTDFRPIFEAVTKLNPMPDIFIFLTDGQGPAPEVPPFFKTIWVGVGPYKTRPCEWGEWIEVKDEG